MTERVVVQEDDVVEKWDKFSEGILDPSSTPLSFPFIFLNQANCKLVVVQISYNYRCIVRVLSRDILQIDILPKRVRLAQICRLLQRHSK